jgi:uncharacterized membrane protein
LIFGLMPSDLAVAGILVMASSLAALVVGAVKRKSRAGRYALWTGAAPLLAGLAGLAIAADASAAV